MSARVPNSENLPEFGALAATYLEDGWQDNPDIVFATRDLALHQFRRDWNQAIGLTAADRSIAVFTHITDEEEVYRVALVDGCSPVPERAIGIFCNHVVRNVIPIEQQRLTASALVVPHNGRRLQFREEQLLRVRGEMSWPQAAVAPVIRTQGRRLHLDRATSDLPEPAQARSLDMVKFQATVLAGARQVLLLCTAATYEERVDRIV